MFLIACVCRQYKDKRMYFEGKEWIFPATVEQAANRYKMQFKPPGYYYTRLPSGGIVQLEFLSEEGDFSDENQSESALHSRRVSTYLFTYPNHKGFVDSLRNALEMATKAKLIAEVDTQRITVEGKTVFSQSIAYWRGMSPDSLVVAIRQMPSFKAQKNYEGEVQIFLFGQEPRNGIVSRLRAF